MLDRAEARTFALKSVWHIVEAGPLVGNHVGEFYVFKCLRWSAVRDVHGVHRQRLLADMELCIPCSRNDR